MEPRFPTPASPEQSINHTIESAIVQSPETKDFKKVPTPQPVEAANMMATADDAKLLAASRGEGNEIDVKKSSVITSVSSSNSLISKVWVDRAKRLVNEFKNDPYVLQSKVEELQIEYLKTQYDKEIGPRV